MSILLNFKKKYGGIYGWLKMSSKYRSFLKQALANNNFVNVLSNNSSTRAAIIIHPWYLTPVPFFIITVGLFLCKKGHKIDFVLDDFVFGNSSLAIRVQVFVLKKVLTLLPSRNIIIMSRLNKPLNLSNVIDERVVKSFATQNTIHYMKGELKKEGRDKYYTKVLDQLKNSNPYICSFFEQSHYSYIYIAGGICANTGLYLAYADRFNVKVKSFDGGEGLLASSTKGVAIHLNDIPIGFKKIKTDLDDQTFEIINTEVKNIQNLRRAGKDPYPFVNQLSGSDNNPTIDSGYLILLNSPWDSAALGIHRVFNSYSEWVLSTIKYILENTEETIIVRQHPAERFPLVRGTDDYNDLISRTFDNNKRIKFINCHAAINTYQLIENTKLVIGFSSTTGVEATIMGKPVIVASKCYYADLGFVYGPKTKQEYFNIITQSAEKKLSPITNQQIKDATICYYLGQCCHWLFTNFTPSFVDYCKWVLMPFETLYNAEEIQMYLYSIESDIPLSYIVSERKKKKHYMEITL